MTVTEFLETSVPFLHGVTHDQASALAHAAEQLPFRPGQTILFRGVTVEGLHVVASGRVIVYAKTKPNSKELFEVAQLGPGSVFGETSIIEMGTASATIKAAEETLIFVIPQDAFRDLLANNEEFRARAEALIAERKKKTDELGRQPVAA